MDSEYDLHKLPNKHGRQNAVSNTMVGTTHSSYASLVEWQDHVSPNGLRESKEGTRKAHHEPLHTVVVTPRGNNTRVHGTVDVWLRRTRSVAAEPKQPTVLLFTVT